MCAAAVVELLRAGPYSEAPAGIHEANLEVYDRIVRLREQLAQGRLGVGADRPIDWTEVIECLHNA